MVTAKIDKISKPVRVDGLLNKGQWWGVTWLIGIGCGFDTHFFVAEAETESDALDVYADSKFAHLTLIEDESEVDEDFADRIGNEGRPHDLTDLRILERCKVNYFAKGES